MSDEVIKFPDKYKANYVEQGPITRKGNTAPSLHFEIDHLRSWLHMLESEINRWEYLKTQPLKAEHLTVQIGRSVYEELCRFALDGIKKQLSERSE